MSVVYQFCIRCDRYLLQLIFVVADMLCMNVAPVVFNVLLQSMFFGYECLSCMNVGLVCDRYLLHPISVVHGCCACGGHVCCD